MLPLASLPAAEARRLDGLLFDLDDTLLSHGLLTRAAFAALWDLHEAGLRLVAVTGRPSGWGQVIARQWPIDGCVTENGAIAVVRDGAGVALEDACDEATRAERRLRLAELVARARTAVPDAALSDDVAARRSDVTWDIGERRRLAEEQVRRIVALIEETGARWSRSSVHLHATFDADDKASGAVRFLAARFGHDAGGVLSRYAFVGDSGNDAACFAAFHTTLGVANVRASLSRLSVPPRFVAEGAMGEGFAEVAAELLHKRC